MSDPQALKDSFAIVCEAGDEVSQYFYSYLFLIAPEVRPMFPVAMGAQRDRFVTALGRIVAEADDPDQLIPFLQQLGRDHRKFQVVAQHYEAAGQALLATLAYFLGDAWTPELQRGWTEAYALVARTMTQAAEEDSAVNPAWWNAQVVRHEQRGPDLAVLTLRPDKPMAYQAGQSVMVEAPMLPSTWRPYTPANAQRAEGTIEFHVRAVDGGLLSPALVYGLRKGEVLRLGAPVGNRLTLRASQGRDLVLIAGGTGLAPLRALVEEIAQHGPYRRVDLFVAARDKHGLYDLSALRQLAQVHPWLRVTPLVGAHAGAFDNRSLAGPVLHSGAGDERSFYICGSSAMVSATVRDLADAGIPDNLLHFEDAR
ncbi:flavohemoprotein [Streptomyces chrestomyceticus JCM 4735]|uniref:nitric oxide dioxygenase n=1 Tax=Streptomyces chrestomyceticus JCM 4735 TaxID=1306181 RepID=A0A7U9KQZ3_9ACTN|nr:globin domain-containing protein [Streptomyces chrestomyceticus]GCD32376.1 flavohemoprotein [Streptomyces chrestomyceticus JCM 4735]